MSYASFLASLKSGDDVTVYMCDYGTYIETAVTAVNPDGFSLDTQGGIEFSASGNGLGYARSAKLMPASFADHFAAAEQIYRSGELEALVE